MFLIQLFKLRKAYENNGLHRCTLHLAGPFHAHTEIALLGSPVGGVITRLILDAVRTGSVTSMVALATMILFLKDHDSNGALCRLRVLATA